MEVVKELRYLGTVFCRHGEIDGEIIGVVEGRSVVES